MKFKLKHITSTVAIFSLALFAFNCEKDFKALTATIDNSKTILQGTSGEIAAFPRVIGISSNNIASHTDADGADWDSERFEIRFSQKLDASTVTKSNIYIRDVDSVHSGQDIGDGTDNDEGSATTFAAVDISLNVDTVYLTVDVFTGCSGACTASDYSDRRNLNEIVISKNVKAENGNGLQGNISCDENFCGVANDYRYVWSNTQWGVAAPGVPPEDGGNFPDGAAAYTPNDRVYSTLTFNPSSVSENAMTITVTLNDSAAIASPALDLITLNGASADAGTVTAAAGSIQADFSGLSANTKYVAKINVSNAALKSMYAYPKVGDTTGEPITKTLFVDRTNDNGESSYERVVWTDYDASSSLPRVSSSTNQNTYDFVGILNYSASASSCFSSVSTNNGDFITSIDEDGDTVYVHVAPGSGDYIFDNNCDGNGDYYFDQPANGYINNNASGAYNQITSSVSIKFNMLMSTSSFTKDNIRVYSTDDSGNTIAISDFEISSFNSADNTFLSISSSVENGIAGYILASALKSASGLTLNGNDGNGSLDSDGALQGKVDSNNNNRYDDYYYSGTIPDGL